MMGVNEYFYFDKLEFCIHLLVRKTIYPYYKQYYIMDIIISVHR